MKFETNYIVRWQNRVDDQLDPSPSPRVARRHQQSVAAQHVRPQRHDGESPRAVPHAAVAASIKRALNTTP